MRLPPQINPYMSSFTISPESDKAYRPLKDGFPDFSPVRPRAPSMGTCDKGCQTVGSKSHHRRSKSATLGGGDAHHDAVRKFYFKSTTGGVGMTARH